METITIGDTRYKLWMKTPDWGKGMELLHAMETVVATSESGRQTRSPWVESMRTSMTLSYGLSRNEVKELDDLLLESEFLIWAVPIWVALVKADQGMGSVIYKSAYVLNFDDQGFAVFQSNELPETTPYKWLAPLLFARMTERPSISPHAGVLGETTLKFEEDSPYEMRLMINRVEVAGDEWPVSLKPTFLKNLEKSDDQIRYDEIGRFRQKVIDGTEAKPVLGQEAHFGLNNAKDQGVRQLLSFWSDRGARLKSFTQPVWFVNPEGYGAVQTDTGVSVNNPVVGFASDKLRLKYTSNAHAETTLRFFQRPTEENGGIEGDDPVVENQVFLLEFEYKIPQPIFYHFAIYEKELVWNENVFESAPFDVAEPTWSYVSEQTKLKITSWRFDGNPLNKLIPFELEAPLMVKIWECDPANVAGTAQLYWAGELVSAKSYDKKIDAECVVFGSDMDIDLPRNLRGPSCPHCVFDRNCRANEGRFRRSGIITAIDDASITISGHGEASGWFERGRLSTGHGEFYEARPIEQQDGNVFDVVKPLRFATVGQAVTLWPGCDGQWETCQNKFDNAVNFGGRPHGTDKNPAIITDDPVQEVGKK